MIFGRQLKIVIIAIPIIIIIFACEKDFPTDSISGYQNTEQSSDLIQSANYPQNISTNLNYNYDTKNFEAGKLEFFDGSNLYIPASSLSLPLEKGFNSPINITGSIENNLNKKEIIFTFGPSGSRFNPPALFCINYNSLTTNGTPKFYFIDSSGKYIQQKTEEINSKAKTMKVNIHHFSRYALAYGR